LPQQLLMRALLDDTAALEHDETVHPRDGGKPVRMAITVLPAISVPRLDWIAASTSLSSADVASSSTRIDASLRITRAMAMRWRWPPDSFTPRSPTCAT